MERSDKGLDTGEMIVKRVSVPIGLEELMEGLAKEVILKKPADIYLFAAKYFSKLLLLRDEGNYKVKTIRSAQTIAEQNRRWSDKKFFTQDTTKSLPRQISVRTETKRKNPATKIPQPGKDSKDESPRIKDNLEKSSSKSELSMEGKQKYMYSKRDLRSISNERPRNIHHRERSQSSTERACIIKPVTDQKNTHANKRGKIRSVSIDGGRSPRNIDSSRTKTGEKTTGSADNRKVITDSHLKLVKNIDNPNVKGVGGLKAAGGAASNTLNQRTNGEKNQNVEGSLDASKLRDQLLETVLSQDSLENASNNNTPTMADDEKNEGLSTPLVGKHVNEISNLDDAIEHYSQNKVVVVPTGHTKEFVGMKSGDANNYKNIEDIRERMDITNIVDNLGYGEAGIKKRVEPSGKVDEVVEFKLLKENGIHVDYIKPQADSHGIVNDSVIEESRTKEKVESPEQLEKLVDSKSNNMKMNVDMEQNTDTLRFVNDSVECDSDLENKVQLREIEVMSAETKSEEKSNMTINKDAHKQSFGNEIATPAPTTVDESIDVEISKKLLNPKNEVDEFPVENFIAKSKVRDVPVQVADIGPHSPINKDLSVDTPSVSSNGHIDDHNLSGKTMLSHSTNQLDSIEETRLPTELKSETKLTKNEYTDTNKHEMSQKAVDIRLVTSQVKEDSLNDMSDELLKEKSIEGIEKIVTETNNVKNIRLEHEKYSGSTQIHSINDIIQNNLRNDMIEISTKGESEAEHHSMSHNEIEHVYDGENSRITDVRSDFMKALVYETQEKDDKESKFSKSSSNENETDNGTEEKPVNKNGKVNNAINENIEEKTEYQFEKISSNQDDTENDEKQNIEELSKIPISKEKCIEKADNADTYPKDGNVVEKKDYKMELGKQLSNERPDTSEDTNDKEEHIHSLQKEHKIIPESRTSDDVINGTAEQSNNIMEGHQSEKPNNGSNNNEQKIDIDKTHIETVTQEFIRNEKCVPINKATKEQINPKNTLNEIQIMTDQTADNTENENCDENESKIPSANNNSEAMKAALDSTEEVQIPKTQGNDSNKEQGEVITNEVQECDNEGSYTSKDTVDKEEHTDSLQKKHGTKPESLTSDDVTKVRDEGSVGTSIKEGGYISSHKSENSNNGSNNNCEHKNDIIGKIHIGTVTQEFIKSENCIPINKATEEQINPKNTSKELPKKHSEIINDQTADNTENETCDENESEIPSANNNSEAMKAALDSTEEVQISKTHGNDSDKEQGEEITNKAQKCVNDTEKRDGTMELGDKKTGSAKDMSNANQQNSECSKGKVNFFVGDDELIIVGHSDSRKNEIKTKKNNARDEERKSVDDIEHAQVHNDDQEQEVLQNETNESDLESLGNQSINNEDTINEVPSLTDNSKSDNIIRQSSRLFSATEDEEIAEKILGKVLSRELSQTSVCTSSNDEISTENNEKSDHRRKKRATIADHYEKNRVTDLENEEKISKKQKSENKISHGEDKESEIVSFETKNEREINKTETEFADESKLETAEMFANNIDGELKSNGDLVDKTTSLKYSDSTTRNIGEIDGVKGSTQIKNGHFMKNSGENVKELDTLLSTESKESDSIPVSTTVSILQQTCSSNDESDKCDSNNNTKNAKISAIIPAEHVKCVLSDSMTTTSKNDGGDKQSDNSGKGQSPNKPDISETKQTSIDSRSLDLSGRESKTRDSKRTLEYNTSTHGEYMDMEAMNAIIADLKTGILSRVVKNCLNNFINKEKQANNILDNRQSNEAHPKCLGKSHEGPEERVNFELKAGTEDTSFKEADLNSEACSKDQTTEKQDNSIEDCEKEAVDEQDIKYENTVVTNTLKANQNPSTQLDVPKTREHLNISASHADSTIFSNSYNSSKVNGHIESIVNDSTDSKNPGNSNKITNTVLAIVKIQSVWRGFIVRKSLNVPEANNRRKFFYSVGSIPSNESEMAEMKRNVESLVQAKLVADEKQKKLEGNNETQFSNQNTKIKSTEESNNIISEIPIRPKSIESNDSVVTVIHKEEAGENVEVASHKHDSDEECSHLSNNINEIDAIQNKLLEKIAGKTVGTDTNLDTLLASAALDDISLEDDIDSNILHQHNDFEVNKSGNLSPIAEHQEVIRDDTGSKVYPANKKASPFVEPEPNILMNLNNNKYLENLGKSKSLDAKIFSKSFEKERYKDPLSESALSQIKDTNFGNITNKEYQTDSSEDTQPPKSPSHLLHTGEMHDTIVVPLNTTETKSETKSAVNGDQNGSLENIEPLQVILKPAGLIHTSELHDSIVLPFAKERFKNDVSSMDEGVGKDFVGTVASSNYELKNDGLFHTGELHDIVPLPTAATGIKTQREQMLENVEENASKMMEAWRKMYESSGLKHTGEFHDSFVQPLKTLQNGDTLREDSAANRKSIACVVSSPLPTTVGIDAQTCVKPGLETSSTDEKLNSESNVVARRSMENRKSCSKAAHTVKPNQEDREMEAKAATKIQAGFRGYQVRKQLKVKNGSSDMHNTQRRPSRSKNVSRLDNSKPKEIEEESAIKIQAGIRGFLVRRRQKKHQGNQDAK